MPSHRSRTKRLVLNTAFNQGKEGVGGGGGGKDTLPYFVLLCQGVLPKPLNPDHISDSKIHLSIPYIRPNLLDQYPTSDQTYPTSINQSINQSILL